MTQFFNSAIGRQIRKMAHAVSYNLRAGNMSLSFYIVIAMCTLLFASCQKTDNGNSQNGDQTTGTSDDLQLSNRDNGLSWQTLWELRQARAATAKYHNINNAFADHYADIGVVMPNMGYHFMKMSIVDSVFDFRRPELLVYNKDRHGKFQLVAIEYAVPIADSPNAPEGFTGNADQWVQFGDLWTLHAWVWQFNPDGVFNPTNPLVEVR